MAPVNLAHLRNGTLSKTDTWAVYRLLRWARRGWMGADNQGERAFSPRLSRYTHSAFSATSWQAVREAFICAPASRVASAVAALAALCFE